MLTSNLTIPQTFSEYEPSQQIYYSLEYEKIPHSRNKPKPQSWMVWTANQGFHLFIYLILAKHFTDL